MSQKMECNIYLVVFLLFNLCINVSHENLEEDIRKQNDSSKLLSRKRRYLIFPEGSSLQLVFCFTMPSVGVGQIFTIGSTAALAWELPHDPFADFRRHSELLHRKDEGPVKYKPTTYKGGWSENKAKQPLIVNSQTNPFKTFYNPFLINNNKLFTPAKKSYNTIKQSNNYWQSYPTYPKGQSSNKRRKIVNDGPGFKYRTYPINNYKNEMRQDFNRPVTSYIHPAFYDVHRRTRRDLYGKIEKFFTSMSRDGKACLLKSVCEVSQASSGKGSFMEEIVKAIFRIKPHDDYKDEDKYDKAANKTHNCTEMYPSCKYSVWNAMFV